MKKRTKYLHKVSLFSFLGVMAIAILAGIFFTEGQALKDPRVFFSASLWSLVIWLTQYYGNGYLLSTLDKKWPWLDYPVKRLLLGFFLVVLYSFSAIIIVNLTFYRIFFGGFPEQFMAWVAFNGRIAVSISLVISTIMTSIGFFRSWRHSVRKEEGLKAEMLDYKYKALLNQVNPHFLFNSLNVLSSLVYEDQELAVKFIRQLSKIYRYTLENRERDLVSMKEEAAFISSYLFLLDIRFEKALEVEIDLPEDEDRFLVPMALQIVIENAIKHNIVSVDDPLKIEIYVKDDYLIVKNPLHPKKDSEESMGFGLDNIRKRLQFLSDLPLIVESESGFFITKIPILKVVE